MTIDYLKFDNFNHSFKDAENEGIELLECKMCNLKVWIGETEFWYNKFKNNNNSLSIKWLKLDISCEEIIIKTLLE